MRRILGAAVALSVLVSGCILGNSPRGAADEITQLANRVSETTYAAVYRFDFTRQPAPGVSTRLEIVQQPPTSLRKVESTTKSEDGKTVSLAYWFVHNDDGDFACNAYEGIGVRCQPNPVARTTFASAKHDVFFDTPRNEGTFSSVRKASRTFRIRGHQGTCFEAVPATPTPPASPGPTPEADDGRFRYELCYADDGILLRGRRTTLDEDASASSAESFVELVSLSRVVEPRELRLPGPLADPDEL